MALELREIVAHLFDSLDTSDLEESLFLSQTEKGPTFYWSLYIPSICMYRVTVAIQPYIQFYNPGFINFSAVIAQR